MRMTSPLSARRVARRNAASDARPSRSAGRCKTVGLSVHKSIQTSLWGGCTSLHTKGTKHIVLSMIVIHDFVIILYTTPEDSGPRWRRVGVDSFAESCRRLATCCRCRPVACRVMGSDGVEVFVVVCRGRKTCVKPRTQAL